MSDRFDNELKRALKAVDPGVDFTAEVMRRVESMEPESVPEVAARPARRPLHRWLPLAIAASVIAAVGIVRVQEQRQEAKALRARQELLAALHVTSEKLNLAYRVMNSQPSIEVESDQ